MKILFWWNFNQAKDVFPNWRDGLRAAIEEIEKTNEVTWHLGKDVPEGKWDAMIIWDDSNSSTFDHLDLAPKRGLCLTTDPQNFENLRKLDVVFCESTPVYEAVRSQGIHAVKAFGTDTDFFTPDGSVKDIPYFYPATFSPWKLQRDISYLGKDLYCVGTIQPDGQQDYQSVIDAGCTVEVGYFPVEHMRDLYRRSKSVIIPAIHGSERTVLEAMSCNVWPQVTNENNIKTKSLIEEYIEARTQDKDLKPRDFVLKNYSHIKYARDILKGLE